MVRVLGSLGRHRNLALVWRRVGMVGTRLGYVHLQIG